MLSLPHTSAIALHCNLDGTVRAVVHNSSALAVQPGIAFIDLVEASSRDKARRFLANLRTRAAAFDWELTMTVEGHVVGWFFTGGQLEQGLMIVGSAARAEDATFFEELLATNNEQLNALRRALKEQSLAARKAVRRDEVLFDELTQLNNELADAQRELARKNAALERMNETKNEFIGMLAHDLRNPLGATLHYSEFMLEEPGALTEEQQQFLGIIHATSRFMLRLVNDALDLTSIEAGHLTLHCATADLHALIQQSVAINAMLAQHRKITLVLAHADALPPLHFDVAKITQVMNNLLSNAVKYSPDGTTVRVEIRCRREAVAVSVCDQGPGIPAEDLEHLFQPFHTASVEAAAGEKSTGLGLAIVHRIVEGHGGHIGVESHPGAGSTFTFTLPLPQPEEAMPRTPDA